MIFAGQIAILASFVATGFAAFAGLTAPAESRLRRTGTAAGLAGVILISAVSAILAWALIVKDFRFAYVAEYSDRLLPWHYSLSAFWVGQSGSLLLWAWLLGVLALIYRFSPGARDDALRAPAFGVLMAYLCFLVAIMVFAADPMQPSLGRPGDGAGLSPLLQHPAMLIHPPVVFLGYAGWAVPFAVAIVALAKRRFDRDWLRQVRPWALFSWLVLGGGILLGADWAYEELGWGGYWGWDPVENGSLVPWLTGTALIHAVLAWQHRGVLKKTALVLVVATFALCNFATFLTRSGIFSSLHAFSQSPIGWMFLLLMVGVAAGAGLLVFARRRDLAPDHPIVSVWSREAFVILASLALGLLAAVAIGGTLLVPVSKILSGAAITVAASFYNNVLIPVGLVLLATTPLAPLLRWGKPPLSRQRRAIIAVVAASGVFAALAAAFGIRHPIALAVAAATAAGVLALLASLMLDATRFGSPSLRSGLLRAVRSRRVQYAGFLMHLGFYCLAVGVTGSSLGTQRHDADLAEGETTHWNGRSIRYVRMVERPLPDKVVFEAELEVTAADGTRFTILPAQHLYRRQDTWTTEVAIRSTWGGDLYAILLGNEGHGRASFTLIENPLMRWLWLSGGLAGAAALVRFWPGRSAASPARSGRTEPSAPWRQPHHLQRTRSPRSSARSSRH